MRSSVSRITLVGYDPSLEAKLDVAYGTTNNIKEFSWFDHLLAVFFIHRRSKSKLLQTTIPESLPEYEDRKAYLESPWVLPVYVLSTERDEHRHLIAEQAKCTIDTGNLQGNIVSRAFLVDILGYSEANFHKLTKEEEDGGIGITGHKLVPEGAVYLTWYHSNSTRVFRNMRFLISENPMCDLVIGAHSIRKNNILDVPNLGDSGGRADKEKDPSSDKLEKLEPAMVEAKEQWGTIRSAFREAKDASDKKKKELKDELAGKKKKYDAAKVAWLSELTDVYQKQVLEVMQKGATPEATKEAERLRRLYKSKAEQDLPPGTSLS